MEKYTHFLYEGERIQNFRELVDRYRNLYKDKIAFEYKIDPKSNDYVRISYNRICR